MAVDEQQVALVISLPGVSGQMDFTDVIEREIRR
jgi:hypothetical protein